MREIRIVVFCKSYGPTFGKWEDEQSEQTTKERAVNLAALCNENPQHSFGDVRPPMSTFLLERRDNAWAVIPTKEITLALLEVKEKDTHG